MSFLQSLGKVFSILITIFILLLGGGMVLCGGLSLSSDYSMIAGLSIILGGTIIFFVWTEILKAGETKKNLLKTKQPK